MTEKLAVLGGRPVLDRPLPPHRSIGHEEKEAVMRVMDQGQLSQFLGTWGERFYGGPEVRSLEKEWAVRFGCREAVALNSATSGLYAAVGAFGIGPGDEVIVPPYTMMASVTAVVVNNAVPVFADIRAPGFTIDPEDVERKITHRTKAVLAVDLFGYPADWDGLRKVADRHGLVLIEDAAQAPGATYGGKHCGTLGDMGVFSLNYHKHIHCGEGGIVVSDDPELAERVRMIRNHGEAVAAGRGWGARPGLVGFNYRMTELEAAVAREQLRKLDGQVRMKRHQARRLMDLISRHAEFKPWKPEPGWDPVFYVLPFRVLREAVPVSRQTLVRAIVAEGVPMAQGYVRPIYREPIFQEKVAFGDKGCPFTCPFHGTPPDYSGELCPECERAHREELLYFPLCDFDFHEEAIDLIGRAMEKVMGNLERLVELEGRCGRP